MPDDARPFSNCLLDLAPPDIAWFQERSDIILVPIGSCEQHGAHLPLGTDTITALEVSRRAAEKADVPYAPPLWAGYSPQHLRQPESGVGTITLRSATFTAVLYDMARSLIHHGWNKLVFVNGHGSNTKVIDPLLRRIKYETGAFVALYKPYAERYIGLLDDLLENPPDETPGWHASELETSQVMAHDPRMVHMDRAAEDRAQVPEWLPESFIKTDGAPDVEFDGYQYFVFPMDHAEFSKTGVIGNPMRATAEKGEQALDRFADHLVKALDRVPRASRSASPSERSRTASDGAALTPPSTDAGAHPARRRRLRGRARPRSRGVGDHGPPRPRAPRARGPRRSRARGCEGAHGSAGLGWGAADRDGVVAARRAGPRGQGGDRRARRTTRDAGVHDLLGRLLDHPAPRAPADAGPAERAHARHELTGDRLRDAGRAGARGGGPRRARPAHEDARRALDGRVPRRS